jgi:hypothetical protein
VVKHLRVMSVLPDQPQTDALLRVSAAGASAPSNRGSRSTTTGCGPGIGRGADWAWIPQQFDASILGQATTPGQPNFTGRSSVRPGRTCRAEAPRLISTRPSTSTALQIDPFGPAGA